MSIEVIHGKYEECLNDVQANLILTSPPYNIGSSSDARITNRSSGGYDSKSYRGIREYSDSIQEEVYQESQVEFLTWALDHLATSGILAYNHKPRRRDGIMIHPAEWFLRVPKLQLMEEIIWNRGSTHNHSPKLMWPHTERVYIFKRSGDPYVLNNTSELNFRSDIWSIPKAPKNGHNAPFPLELARNIILAWSEPGQLVVDPYTGSGTTALACLRSGRSFVGSEMLEKYYSMALDRIANEP